MRGGRASRAARFERRARVEMLPLLDVVFLVLAVFLFSVVRMVRSYAVPVELPTMASGVEERLPSVLLLSVDEEGQSYLAGEARSLDAILGEVGQRLADDPELQVLLQADRAARHGEVSALLDVVRSAGATRILLVADPTDELQR